MRGGGVARSTLAERPAQIVTDVSDATELADIESSAVEHMNADHPDALQLYAVKLCGEREGRWRATEIRAAEGDIVAVGTVVAVVVGCKPSPALKWPLWMMDWVNAPYSADISLRAAASILPSSASLR